jgi:hypothetical protein
MSDKIRKQTKYLLLLFTFLLVSACSSATIEMGFETLTPEIEQPTKGSVSGRTNADISDDREEEPTQTPEPTPTPTPEPGTVNGGLCYPSEYIPEMMAYFQKIDSHQTTKLHIDENQLEYSLQLPPGTYLAFVYLEEGELGGFYSHAVTCGLGANCTDHRPLEFEVVSNQETNEIDICDWYAPQFLPSRPPDTMVGIQEVAGLMYSNSALGGVIQVGTGGEHCTQFSIRRTSMTST